jgi:2-hydroxy-3-keto-5-methylthiopentenyl-1-phosphate phosphatase
VPNDLSAKDGYREYLTTTLQEKYLQARRSFDDFNLSEELTVLRLVLGKVLEGIEKDEKLKVESVTKLVREIRETLKVMVEWMEKSMVPVATLHIVQQQVVLILREELKDDERLQRIASRLGQIALPRDSRESDRLQAADRRGEVSLPNA